MCIIVHQREGYLCSIMQECAVLSKGQISWYSLVCISPQEHLFVITNKNTLTRILDHTPKSMGAGCSLVCFLRGTHGGSGGCLCMYNATRNFLREIYRMSPSGTLTSIQRENNHPLPVITKKGPDRCTTYGTPIRTYLTSILYRNPSRGNEIILINSRPVKEIVLLFYKYFFQNLTCWLVYLLIYSIYQSFQEILPFCLYIFSSKVIFLLYFFM